MRKRTKKFRLVAQPTSHHRRLVLQGKVESNPALSILFLIPAPSRRPNTVSRKRVTTSWSLGESRSVVTSVNAHLRSVGKLTETTSFYIPFLPSCSVKVGVPYLRPRAFRQVLIQTPLLGTRQAWLARIVGYRHMQNSIIRTKADT